MKMKQTILSLVAATSFLFSIAQTPANTVTTTRQEHTISVNGSAEAEVVPDEIYVQVNLSEYKKGSTKTDIETIKNAFLKNMKALGYTDQDISVQSYTGWDGNTWWYNKKKKNNDLLAGINYWVKVASTNKMDELVSKLDDEATTNFFIAKTAYSKVTDLRKQLKIEAIKNAKSKAEYLAGAVSEKIGSAITINEPSERDAYQPPVLYAANSILRREGGVEETPMTTDFKKIKLQYEVNVVFALQ
jgi:uncharacterized protein